MWVKTTLEKLNEYGINITTQRQLTDGEYILHFELSPLPQFILDARFDIAVKLYTNEQMEEIISLEPQEG